MIDSPPSRRSEMQLRCCEGHCRPVCALYAHAGCLLRTASVPSLARASWFAGSSVGLGVRWHWSCQWVVQINRIQSNHHLLLLKTPHHLFGFGVFGIGRLGHAQTTARPITTHNRDRDVQVDIKKTRPQTHPHARSSVPSPTSLQPAKSRRKKPPLPRNQPPAASSSHQTRPNLVVAFSGELRNQSSS